MSLNCLPKLLALLENQPSWNDFRQYKILRESWLNLVGSKAFENSRPLYINRNILFCATSNSVWAQTLSLQRYILTQKINTTLSLKIVDLRFSPAQWYYRSLNSPTESTSLTQHPSYIPPLKSVSPPSAQNCQNTAQRWLETLKKRQSKLPLCPQCQTPTPQGELTRWGVCMHCFNL
jgi:predicted nucleic acid-binding Zn ribbon protein